MPQKGKGGLSCSFTLVSWLAGEGSSPQTRHCEKQSPRGKPYRMNTVFPEKQTLRNCFKVELRLLTYVNSSHFPLARHTSLQIYKHTQTCLTIVASSIHTIHPPQWPGRAYTKLEHIFTPQQFTLGLWQLIVYATVALQGHHSLSACPSVALSICLSERQTGDRALILDHSLKWSQRCCEVTAKAGIYSCCPLSKAILNVLTKKIKTLQSTAVSNGLGSL